jgi:hypothetical protein
VSASSITHDAVPAEGAQPGERPAHAALVLVALISVAAVANLNQDVSKCAVPVFGEDLD